MHQETCVHLDRTLHLKSTHGCKRGVVLNAAKVVKRFKEFVLR